MVTMEEELIAYIARALVDRPGEVTVTKSPEIGRAHV